MGADCYAILDGYLTAQEITNTLAVATACNIKVRYLNEIGDYYRLNFVYAGEQRSMSVFVNGNCCEDYAHVTTEEATLVSVSCWGYCEEIMTILLDVYGGYYDFNDSDDIDYQRHNKTVDLMKI